MFFFQSGRWQANLNWGVFGRDFDQIKIFYYKAYGVTAASANVAITLSIVEDQGNNDCIK